MTICCQCGRHYWPGKGVCPSAAGKAGEYGVACNHTPCDNCQRYVDEKEKGYDRTKRKQARRSQKA
jgi:hypothetical protein